MKLDWRVKVFRYPIKKRLYDAFVELLAYPRMWFSSISFWIFHVTMILMIISWLAMDLPFFITGLDESIFEPGGLVYPIRIFHRFVGAAFVVAFVLYAIQLFTNERLRGGLEPFDYIEFGLIATLVVYGVSYTLSSVLGYAFSFLPLTIVKFSLPWRPGVFVVPLHIFIVYGWFLSSIIFNGAIMKAMACIAIVFIRSVSLPEITRLKFKIERKRPFKNLTKYGVLQLLACGKCGDCIDACPVYEHMKDEPFSPRTRVLRYKRKMLKQRGLISLLFKRKVSDSDAKELSDVLYGCTLCGRCITLCPNELDLVNLFKAARESAFALGSAPEIIRNISSSINAEKNLYGLPNESRTDWIEFESAKVPRKRKAETVYFIGCLTSYSGRLNKIAKSISAILNYLGEDWTILGEGEWCCGAPLELSGATTSLGEIAKHNVEAIEVMGAKRVIFNCPACYRMFKEVYPRILGRELKFECIHVVDYLSSKLREGKLTPKRKFDGVVTYHDPCELSRLLGLINEPRLIISRFASRIVELPENKMAGKCCGGGGVMKAILPDASNKLAAARIEQVKDVEAELLLSACPSCYLTLGDVVMMEELPIRVIDIVELVAEQLELI